MKEKLGKSKTSRINHASKKILDVFQCYSLYVRDWEPAKEGDWNDVIESLNEILEEVVT